MLDAAIAETDTAKREAMWGPIDKKVMEDAYILPGVYAKSLLIRPKKLTNVFISQAYNMYDYAALGVA
jgi:peptide/nickel transport system substrate-binding protein